MFAACAHGSLLEHFLQEISLLCQPHLLRLIALISEWFGAVLCKDA